jgi:DNA primase
VSRYTAESRDRVFEAVDMLALVGSRVELQRRGVDSYFGRCPFHEERTGSFHVRPDAKHYYCFGCQASGDPFTWVMETEGMDFKGALESLADRFGVALSTESEDPEAADRRRRRERLFALLDRAATYYSRYLWEAGEAADARAYLRDRGLGEEILREFRVGYAPSAWDKMLLASRRTGFSEEELLSVGLAQRSRNAPGRIYDRFRERIMFPAIDARGRVHGFGARRMRDNQVGVGGAKYLNTSDGELYHKREVLFGIDRARAAGAKAGRMILVEGYTDVLALHQAGIRNAVGIMGTSLTEEQITQLERVVTVLELCLDADAAGQEAMLRAARVAAGRTLELRVVALPPGTDPADLVARDGPEEVKARVAASVPFPAFRVGRIIDQADIGSAEGRAQAVAELAPVLGELAPGVVRDDLVRRAASRLELSESQLSAALGWGGAAGGVGRGAGAWPGSGSGARPGSGSGARLGSGSGARLGSGSGARPGSGAGSAGGDGGSVANGLSHAARSERLFLALCLAHPDAGAAALGQGDVTELVTSRALRRAAAHIATRLTAPMSDLPSGDEELARAVADLVALAGRVPDPSPQRLEHARLVLERERLDRAIIRARGEGTPISELAHQREEVREAILAASARLERTV